MADLEKRVAKLEESNKKSDEQFGTIAELIAELESRASAVEALETVVARMEDTLTALELDMGVVKRMIASGGNGGAVQVVAKTSNQKFAGNTGAKRCKDTKTGTVYDSLGKAAKAVCTAEKLSDEKGALDPDDKFVYYRLIKLLPERLEKIDK